jgi:hypothetical protein
MLLGFRSKEGKKVGVNATIHTVFCIVGLIFLVYRMVCTALPAWWVEEVSNSFIVSAGLPTWVVTRDPEAYGWGMMRQGNKR